jgi:hypothetical protein
VGGGRSEFASGTHRENSLGVAGWAAVADALELLPFLTSVDGCDQYSAIRTGGLQEINVEYTELGICTARFLERSASTLTKLDLRCALHRQRRGGGGGGDLYGCHGKGVQKDVTIRSMHSGLVVFGADGRREVDSSDATGAESTQHYRQESDEFNCSWT